MHFFGQESILAPCEENIKAQPREVVDKWLDLAERVYEREDLLEYSEHLMYTFDVYWKEKVTIKLMKKIWRCRLTCENLINWSALVHSGKQIGERGK